MSNREIALKFLESFSTGDPNAIASHVSQDFQNNQICLLGDDCTGRDTYRERLAGFLAGFRNLHYAAEKVIAEDDNVAVAYTMNFEENDRPVKVRGVMLLTMADGLITVRTDYWDGLTYLRQTGVEDEDP